MSILRVANVQFNASGTRRIDYDATADDGIIKISADAVKLPIGDTASRPNSQAGMIRYNSDLGLFEGANSTTWGSIGGVVDFATANGWANTVGTAGNNYTNYVGASANSWANAVGQNANVYAYATAVSIGGAGNNYTYFSVLPAYNTANAAFTKANSALQNTSLTLAGSLSTTGTVSSNGYVYVTALDGGQEGGEIQISGAGNYAGWALDAYQNNHRTFVRTGSTLANLTYFHALGGSVRMGVNKTDPLYTLDVSGDFNATGNLLFNSGYGSAATAYGCRAWITYDGANLSIKGSGGITSVSRSATGQFQYNLSFTMPDTNYAVVTGWHNSDDGGTNTYPGFTNNFVVNFGWAYTTTAFRAGTLWGNNTWHNPYWVSYALFR